MSLRSRIAQVRPFKTPRVQLLIDRQLPEFGGLSIVNCYDNKLSANMHLESLRVNDECAWQYLEILSLEVKGSFNPRY